MTRDGSSSTDPNGESVSGHMLYRKLRTRDDAHDTGWTSNLKQIYGAECRSANTRNKVCLLIINIVDVSIPGVMSLCMYVIFS